MENATENAAVDTTIDATMAENTTSDVSIFDENFDLIPFDWEETCFILPDADGNLIRPTKDEKTFFLVLAQVGEKEINKNGFGGILKKTYMLKGTKQFCDGQIRKANKLNDGLVKGFIQMVETQDLEDINFEYDTPKQYLDEKSQEYVILTKDGMPIYKKPVFSKVMVEDIFVEADIDGGITPEQYEEFVIENTVEENTGNAV